MPADTRAEARRKLEAQKPCSACPWVSKDPRDLAAIEGVPGAKAAVERGEWFCCHVNMGTCHGARLRSEAAARARKTPII